MITIISNFFYTVLANVFYSVLKIIFSNKTLKKRHTKSMILWIFQNNNMSFFQKTGRYYLLLLFALYFRKGSQYRIVCSVNGCCSPALYSLIRNVELLMKKEYIVLLELSITEKTLSHIDSESRLALVQLINLLKQQKALKYS